MRAGQRGRARVERLAVERVRPPQRPPALERAARRGARARGSSRRGSRVAAGVEAVGRRRVARQHRDVGGQQRVERWRRTGGAVVARRPAPSACTPRRCARRPSAATGSRRSTIAERALELPLDRAPAGLARPAGEPGAVVLEEASSVGVTHDAGTAPVAAPLTLDQLEEDHLGRVASDAGRA